MKNMIKIVAILSILLVSISVSSSVFKDSKHLKADGKNVMLFFGTKTCPYCKILKKDFAEDEEINKILKEQFNVYYIPLDEQIDYDMGEKTPPMKTNTISLKMGFSVKATPQIILLDEDWKKIIQRPGYTDREQMKIFLDYVQKDIYKTKDLLSYLQEKDMVE